VIHTHDWGSDPFTCGAYSYVFAGSEDAPGILARPIAGTLFFAGEALAHDAPRGTMQGALESGRRAAARVLEALGG
jgi:monoamine oxidase